MNDNQKREGICYLVGAGPGEPGLLTVKGRECLEQADVVVYDSLAGAALLKLAPPTAELIDAGKRAADHKLSQEEINGLLVSRTREGATVVRLKGGDPILFGRGGEEAAALKKAGLHFEIVPGITSAIAGPAYAGIPVTHRGVSAVFTAFTGHEDPSKDGGDVDYEALARLSGTKVMLMGVQRLETVTNQFLEHGADPAMPVAVIEWAATGRQRTVTGTLKEIVAVASREKIRAPAITVFGEVTELRDRLRWFEDRPLFGKRVVVTRTRHQASALTARLQKLGGEVIEIPTIRTAPPVDIESFREMVKDAHIYDWLVFTSQNGVEAFFDAFFEVYDDIREIGGVNIAALGPATAEALRARHLKVDFQPTRFVAESFVEEFGEQGSLENLRILLVRADVARRVIPDRLSERGAIVDETVAYRTVLEDRDPGGQIERLKGEGADLVTFTSSSTAANFMALQIPLPQGVKTASIGPVTSATMKELGLPVDIEAAQHDIPGLISAIKRFYQVA